MAEFKKDRLENFLAVVRKYMQLRGGMSQKDLAEETDTGVSTMSRFLSQKTTEFNPQLIAKITAKLNIPIHEMVDFVEDDFVERFTRLVKFYKDELGPEPDLEAKPAMASEEKKASSSESKAELSIREKLETLTPRQKAFLNEFLNLKLEERDLVVDVGNNLMQYFRLKGMNI